MVGEKLLEIECMGSLVTNKFKMGFTIVNGIDLTSEPENHRITSTRDHEMNCSKGRRGCIEIITLY